MTGVELRDFTALCNAIRLVRQDIHKMSQTMKDMENRIRSDNKKMMDTMNDRFTHLTACLVKAGAIREEADE